MLKRLMPAALLLAAFCGPAAAGNVDFSVVLVGTDGKPFADCSAADPSGKCTATVDMTLGRLAIAAIAVPDKNATLIDQVARGKLAYRISGAGTLDLTTDEIALIKARIGALGVSPLAVWQACKLLDPAQCKD